MEVLLTTGQGMEEVAALEAQEVIDAASRIIDGGIIVPIKNIKQLCELCYKAQSITKTILLLENVKPTESFALKNVEDWPGSFRASALSLDDSVENNELEQDVGAAIKEKTNETVDLENPDVVFYVFLNKNHKMLGIDFSGIDLSKRDYKIFNTRQSVKGTLAYFLLRYADYKRDHILVDPFCDTGEIIIEAAHYTYCLSVNSFHKDKLAFSHFSSVSYQFPEFKVPAVQPTIFGFSHLLNDIKSAQKNAKIAGVHKLISFSKVEADWLDIKFKDVQVDRIITKIFFTQHTSHCQ